MAERSFSSHTREKVGCPLPLNASDPERSEEDPDPVETRSRPFMTGPRVGPDMYDTTADIEETAR